MVDAGQCTQAGIKAQNEDCCGIHFPKGSALNHKGIVAVMADGVGNSEAGREASEHCVQSFIADYMSTPDSWTVKTSAQRVLHSLNAWLYSQGQYRFHSDVALASTVAILIIKSTTAYLLHVGDSRIYHIRDGDIKALTKDHRLIVDQHKNYLARAMGAEHDVRAEYGEIAIQKDDLFLLSTDGVHEFLSDIQLMQAAQSSQNLEEAAQYVLSQALQAGSNDNLSCQILRIEQLPNQSDQEFYRNLTSLPFPPPLSIGQTLDDYKILKELHSSATIQVYLAKDNISEEVLVLKTPSIHFEDDPAYIDRFVREEWVGRRINNPHVFKIKSIEGKRTALYYATEYLEGQSLAQWILDHPKPDLSVIRDIVQQIVKGLRAFHRREMVHQDIKPENIMVDQHDRIKIIDFGCVHVSGLQEIYTPVEHIHIQGTANYIAPELFSGYEGTPKSDMFSLGVTLYEMLSNGHFPYPSLEEAKPHKQYHYTSVSQYHPDIPAWMDGAIQRSVHPDPEKRYDSFSEFLQDLSKPNASFMKQKQPLISRNPIVFWQCLTLLLLITNIITLFLLKI